MSRLGLLVGKDITVTSIQDSEGRSSEEFTTILCVSSRSFLWGYLLQASIRRRGHIPGSSEFNLYRKTS